MNEEVSNEDLIEELKAGKKEAGTARAKTVDKWLLAIAAVALFILFANWLYNNPASTIVSDTTIHWHAELKITEYGRQIVIPPSVGLLGDVAHPSNLHTHEADNIIHMEIPGPVEAEQVMLGAFFDVWGKEKKKIVKMFVNGRPTSEGYDYIMRDGDTIEVVYE
jgi:hypothetical protein